MVMENTTGLPAPKTDARYTRGEERLNYLSHAAGALFGLAVLIFGVVKSAETSKAFGILASVIYGIGMTVCYTVSAVYHGLPQNAGKNVLRVVDHCTIYLLIMGTYAGIFLAGVLPHSFAAAVSVLAVEAGLGVLAVTLTAAGMKRFAVWSMICYILMGWCMIVIPHVVIAAISLPGFLWVLAGGIAYTLGSVLYGIGKKKRYIHGVFHLCCLAGSVLQFVAFAVYCF